MNSPNPTPPRPREVVVKLAPEVHRCALPYPHPRHPDFSVLVEGPAPECTGDPLPGRLVWTVPAEPGREVTAVTDRYVRVWRRHEVDEGPNLWCWVDDAVRHTHLRWVDLIMRLYPLSDASPLATCSCKGKRWVEDENWQPELWEMQRGRIPASGLLPCGFCNEGGWDTPVASPLPVEEEVS